ncbi:MAG: DUF4178 domain-containing protein [Bacteroidota bacterium]
MFSREFECPSCGSPIKQSSPGARSLICSYCGQTSHLNADSLQAAGEKHLLIDYGSVLEIGKFGRFRDREFMILGRLRIDYEDGFWDEWYIQYLDDGGQAWIQEDDGSFTVFEEKKQLQRRLDLSQMSVGQVDNFLGEWEPVFLTSKSKAQVNGGEGELPFRIVPGEPADFVEGIANGEIVSVEVLPDETVLFVGEQVELEELGLT